MCIDFRKYSNFKSFLRNQVRTHALISIAMISSIAVLIPQTLNAAQQGIPFGGTVGVRHYCQIVLTGNGVMAPSPDFLELSSMQAGGVAGVAEITTTNGSFDASIDTPTGFSTMPTGGDTGVSFSSNYSMTGVTTVPQTPGGTVTKLKRGLTNLSANFIATRVGSVFPAGSYSSVLVLRCE